MERPGDVVDLATPLASLPDPLGLLTAFFDASPTALQIFDVEGRSIATNRAFRELFGAAPPEGYNVLRDDVAERQGILPMIRRAFAGEAVRVPTVWYDARELRSVSVAEGRRVAISASLFPLWNRAGEVRHVATAFRDVTAETLAREEAEGAARRAEEARGDLRYLADAGALLASSLDVETTLANVLSLAVPRLGDFGFLDLVEGESVRRLPVAHADPERLAVLRGTTWRRSERRDVNLCALSSGKAALHPGVDDAWLAMAAGGSPEALALMKGLGFRSMLTVPLRDRGETLGALTLFRVSGPQTPQELALAEELGRRAALAIANARLMGSLSDAVRVRDDFLSIASHELRTPLSTLRIAADTLQRMSGSDGAPGRIEATAGRITRQVARLEGLVDTLLDVSRITQGRLALELAPTDLAAVAGEVVTRLSDSLVDAGCLVALTAEKGVVGSWDPHRIDQVVTNLLSNAMKYGRGRPIALRVFAGPGRAYLSVKDEGIGISPEDQSRIFGRFERAVSGSHYGGMGLGLWISQRIVEAHGGTIRLESAPGRGATFTMELPA